MLAVKPEGADDFPQMHRLVWAFAARICDRYQAYFMEMPFIKT